jgi:hypothetical protein
LPVPALGTGPTLTSPVPSPSLASAPASRHLEAVAVQFSFPESAQYLLHISGHAGHDAHAGGFGQKPGWTRDPAADQNLDTRALEHGHALLRELAAQDDLISLLLDAVSQAHEETEVRHIENGRDPRTENGNGNLHVSLHDRKMQLSYPWSSQKVLFVS